MNELINSKLAFTNVMTTTQEVVNITKSLKFTQEELHDSLANVKDGIKQVQADL